MVHISGQEPDSALEELGFDGVHPVRQTRGRQTRDALLGAGQRLITKHSIDALAVADIARAADCSVGAFYQRFRDKTAFFRALIAQYLAEGRAATLALYVGYDGDRLIHALVAETADRFRRHAGLIRSAIRMRMDDRTIWDPIRASGHFNAGCFVEWLGARHGRSLTADEELAVRFAFQMLYATLNNAIINQPGPLDIEDLAFVTQLERAFRLLLTSAGMWPIPVVDPSACKPAAGR
jgi:AcrR family transcriptional regulator